MPGLVDPTLRLAEQVAEVLTGAGVPTVLIGAMALAVHHYPRATEDVDLAIAVSPRDLERLASSLRLAGWDVQVRHPDATDPLGGVIDVRAPGAELVQVINFDNSPAGGFPRLVREAIPRALPMESSALRVVDLPMLVAFKLYAGGLKSATDVLELLERNDVDVALLEENCASLGLGEELERVLALREAKTSRK